MALLNCSTLFSIVKRSKNVDRIPKESYTKFLVAAYCQDEITIMELYQAHLDKILLEGEKEQFKKEFLKIWHPPQRVKVLI